VKLIAIVLVSLSIAAQAALPPFAESARRIKTVLESRQLSEELGIGSTITAINATASGYLVRANRCGVEVAVWCGETAPGIVGPCPLELRVGSKVCN
jgi:hypothetical protein